MLPDIGAVSIEDLAIANIMSAKLKRCIALLPPTDQALIEAIFYDGLSERAYADLIGVSQNAVNKRKRRIIEKLQKFFKKQKIRVVKGVRFYLNSEGIKFPSLLLDK